MIHFFWFPWGPGGLDHQHYEEANRETVKGAWRYFGGRMTIHHMNSTDVIDAADDDVLLGAPSFPYPESVNSWMEANRGKRCYSMAPWIDNKLHDRFVEPILATRLFFAMCGTVWYDKSMKRELNDPLAGVCQRLVRINMGCDARLLNSRHDLADRNLGFLHMSDLRAAKDPNLLYSLFDGQRARLFIGTSRQRQTNIENVVHLGHLSNTNPAHESLIFNTCAFYVHTSWTDAQSTAILENCARGLVPILTPESGFASEHALYFKRGDSAYNRGLIMQATQMSPEEYTRRSVGVRQQIAEHHGWSSIYKRIEDCIAADRAGETFDRRGGAYS